MKFRSTCLFGGEGVGGLCVRSGQRCEALGALLATQAAHNGRTAVLTTPSSPAQRLALCVRSQRNASPGRIYVFTT